MKKYIITNNSNIITDISNNYMNVTCDITIDTVKHRDFEVFNNDFV